MVFIWLRLCNIYNKRVFTLFSIVSPLRNIVMNAFCIVSAVFMIKKCCDKTLTVI